MSNEFPAYNDEGLSEYIEKIRQYRQNINKDKYDVILKFIKKWVDKKNIMTALTDFKNIKLKNLPNEKKCLKMLNKTDIICTKLNINYNFDQISVEKKYDKTESDISNVEKRLVDVKCPFRPEILILLIKTLNTIGYKLVTTKNNNNILLSIISKNTIN